MSRAPRTRVLVLLARVLLLGLGVAITLNAIWLAATANITLGTVMVALVGLTLLAWGIWLPKLWHQRWLTVMAALVLVAVLSLSCFLAGVGRADNVDYHESAVVVLGAAVHGSELSRTLQGRLDTALAYHQRNPDALIVVSGGQGPQENLPEAVAMRDYLVGQGVASDRIVVEDRSTSTEENFANSMGELAARTKDWQHVAFVTDEFHVYRAAQIASRHGVIATHMASQTPWYFWPANYLREDLMVLLWWVTGS